MEDRNIIRDRQGRLKNKDKDSGKGKAIAEDEDTSPPSEHVEGSSSGTSSRAAASFRSEYALSTASSSAASLATASSAASLATASSLGASSSSVNSSSANASSDTSGSSDLRARLQRKQRDSRLGRHDATSSTEPSSIRNSSRPDTDAQSASQSSANKTTASDEASPADSAFAASNETPADNSSQELLDRAKAEKNARRNAKKKAKKKEKKLKLALLGTSGSTDQGEVLSEECTPAICANDDIDLGDEPASQETTSVDQLSHSQININYLIGNSNSSSITDSSEPKEPNMSIPEDGRSTQTKDQQFSISERPEERHDDGQLNCCDDTPAKNTSNMPGWIIRDSVSAGHEAITEAGYDVNWPNLETCRTETKECFSDQSSLNVTSVTKFQTECRIREVKLVMPGKKNKRAKKLPQNGPERKENGPSARQKVQRDKLSKSEQSDDTTLSGCAKKDPSSSPVNKSTVTLKNDPGLKILGRPDRPVLENGDEPASGEKSSSDSHKRGTHDLETEISKILVALNDSYRARQLCEALQVGTGNPIAEFERLIGAATPAICLWDKEFGRPLCSNEIPNISLEHLWTWYIEPGSYGVVVSTEDFGYSNSTGFRLSDFHAHFVPSLSAVQLFEKSRAFGTVDKHLPDNHNISFAHVHVEVAEDPELIFEYFESDLPQLRPPLHEKIKDLVSGAELSPNKTYGDSTKLCSMKLNQLHPRSWFAVAWYPIYRIPIGELRASFLTFHLFSHLVIKNCTSSSEIMGNCVVSPVVGFQSYHAKRWLLSRQFGLSQTGDATRSASEILRERLQTLERAASVLAKGEVSKEDKKVVNKHPDYEFFFSRGP